MDKPATSIELVLKWAKKASVNCRKQGRNEAGQLWEDAIEQLEYLTNQLSDAKAHIQFLTERLDERPDPPEKEG